MKCKHYEFPENVRRQWRQDTEFKECSPCGVTGKHSTGCHMLRPRACARKGWHMWFAAGRSGSPGEEEGGKKAAVQEGHPRSGKGSGLN